MSKGWCKQGNLKRAETVDGDDQVVYTWSLPDKKTKRAETVDGDDQVVYTWSLPDEKIKRAETVDGDDQVVYTWSLPDEKWEDAITEETWVNCSLVWNWRFILYFV